MCRSITHSEMCRISPHYPDPMKQSIPGVRQNEAELKIQEEAARLHPDQFTVSPSLSFHTWASNPDVITPWFYDLAHLLPWNIKAMWSVCQPGLWTEWARRIQNILWWWSSENNTYILKLATSSARSDPHYLLWLSEPSVSSGFSQLVHWRTLLLE